MYKHIYYATCIYHNPGWGQIRINLYLRTYEICVFVFDYLKRPVFLVDRGISVCDLFEQI